MRAPENDWRRKAQELEARLAETEAALRSLIDKQVDAVAAPGQNPVLLRKAQDTLRASEEKHRLLIQHMPDIVWTIDAAGRVLFLGGKVETISGYTMEDVYAGGVALWLEQTHPEDRPRLKAAIQDMFDRRAPLAIEYRFQRKDGKWIWLRTRSAGAYKKGGARVADGVDADITERQEAALALERQTTILSAVVENVGDGLVVADTAGKFLFYNPAATRMVGIGAQDEPIEKWPKNYGAFLPDGVTLFPPASMPIARAIRGESCDEVEMFIRNSNVPDGVLISLTGRPMRNPRGDLIGGVVVFRDVTERKRAQEARERLATIVEASDDAILSIALDGTILSWNRGAERLYGYLAKEAVGRSVTMLLPPELRDEFQNISERLKAGESVSAQETTRLRKDGKKVFISLSASALRDGGGRLIGISSISRDIGPRKAMEEELRQSQKMDAVGRLAGGVAHDFNNMLTAILGFGNMLRRGIEATDPRREDVEQIILAAEQAAAITRQLLTFGRRQVVQPVVLNLNDNIKNVGGMLKRLLSENIALELAFAPDLGQTRADPGQIEQIVLNLSLNARDAMPGGGKITIETANVDLDAAYVSQHVGVRAGPYVMLAVSDTGGGMDAETKSRIFEPFFTTKAQGEGTGLGLSIVHGIVKQSGGEIWVYSEPGWGSTFKIYLPRLEAPAAPRPRKNDALPGGTETILLVEDEEAVMRLAVRALTACGYKILQARSGEEALRVIGGESHAPALLLTDVVMPGMSGRELAERLSAERPALKVLYMSGYADNAVIQHGILEPGIEFIQKPFSPESLTAKVRAVLNEDAARGRN